MWETSLAHILNHKLFVKKTVLIIMMNLKSYGSNIIYIVISINNLFILAFILLVMIFVNHIGKSFL